MNPISAFTATSLYHLRKGTVLKEITLQGYTLKIIAAEFCLWILAEWPQGGQIAFKAAYAANDHLEVESIEETDAIEIALKGTTVAIKVTIVKPDAHKPIFGFKTVLTPLFDMLVPYWPRDIMPLYNNGKTQNTKGTIHAAQVGTRSGLLFFSLEQPHIGSVFYFQDLGSLQKYCEHTETSAGDLVGGSWPELGMKLPVTTKEKPLKAGEEYIISDAYVLLSNVVPNDNYQVSQQFINHLADIYLLLPHPDTQYHDWPDMLSKGLNDLETHKGCWQFADGRSYLNAYVSDYKTPPESMVQLAVLLPLMDYDRWSGENHCPVIETLHNGLENFFDKRLGTIARWLPAKTDDLDRSEEQKKLDIMDSWYLHHPLLNLSRLAIDGDDVAKKLLLDSIEYVINVAHHFDYSWPVFYNMATLEVIKAETEEGQGGEKDVPGAYAHLMIQVWQLTGNKKYFDEAVTAARKLDGLGFDIFYQANNTAFSAGALLRLYKETKDELFLNLSYLCIAGILKNVQLWDCNYGNAKHYPTYFAIYPLKDAPYTAAYEEQEVFAGIHMFLKEADGMDEILPSVRLLLAELVKHVINRVSYYYPPRLPKEVLATKSEIKMGEIDPNLWVALEDLQDGWVPSGQVGQEVYGAGIAFGIVPRQFYKIEAAGFMVFTEYPACEHKVGKNTLSFYTRGDSQLNFRMAILPLKDKLPAKITVTGITAGLAKESITPKTGTSATYTDYTLRGDSHLTIKW
ncbi:hypothetical protein FMM05_00630 [Flavobacterium zepuense]|uniref:Uncharacterized protein n=1 Tax=Flavobacterium zepuense TaxID=2593302 RepID=A0A552V9U4_9FLAO|nr:hypothetical protein [Flavobacterium zepuense]TRW27180.1 hypothetical protein FMM05_00630 [Flavobacterium zepuense]